VQLSVHFFTVYIFHFISTCSMCSVATANWHGWYLFWHLYIEVHFWLLLKQSLTFAVFVNAVNRSVVCLVVGNAFPGLFFHSRESGMCKRHSWDSRAPGNKEMHGGMPVLPNGQRTRHAIVYS